MFTNRFYQRTPENDIQSNPEKEDEILNANGVDVAFYKIWELVQIKSFYPLAFQRFNKVQANLDVSAFHNPLGLSSWGKLSPCEQDHENSSPHWLLSKNGKN